MQKTGLAKVLKDALKQCKNPTDLKAINIATVVKLEPLTVSLYEGKVLLREDNELYISEWFRFRCNIDGAKWLSEKVKEDLQNANAVKETHSNGGAPCQMPNAITCLADAIDCVATELLALKCDLKLGDYVAVGSREQTDRYILLDKVL